MLRLATAAVCLWDRGRAIETISVGQSFILEAQHHNSLARLLLQAWRSHGLQRGCNLFHFVLFPVSGNG
jgi:hypothetical protein